ncbi:MAG: Flp family type IVb pilin [Pseudomonadota bacterium]
MNSLRKLASRWCRDDTGATAVEYGLIAALMTLALVGALAATGDGTSDKWEGVADDVGDAMSNAGL